MQSKRQGCQDVHWIIGKMYAKKIKDQNQKIGELSAFKPLQDRRTDIVAFSGATYMQMESPREHWIVG